MTDNRAKQMRKPKHVTLDDRPITKEQWADYDKRMEEWRERYKGRLLSFEAAMAEPNPPNYFRANND